MTVYFWDKSIRREVYAKNNQMFIIWLILLPWWCHGITEMMDFELDIRDTESLTALLQKKFIYINGQLTSLREIYGDAQVTHTNFHSGSEVLTKYYHDSFLHISEKMSPFNPNCAGGECVERELLYQGTSSDPKALSTSRSSTTITTTTVAEGVVSNKKDFFTAIITSDTKMGKSIALTNIQYKIVQLKPQSWNIKIDLAHVWQTLQSQYPELWTNDEMIEQHGFRMMMKLYINENIESLFFNIVDVNPNNVIILFDNINKLTMEQFQKITLILESIVRHGITTIIAAGPRDAYNLQLRPSTWINYKIPELKIHETEKYLTNIWKMKITEKMHDIPSSSHVPSWPIDIAERLNDYVISFTQLLYQTSILKAPIVLNALAEKFTHGKDYLSLEFFEKIPIGCVDYVLSETAHSKYDLMTILQHVSVHKGKLYEDIFHAFYTKRFYLEDLVDIYGPIALRILYPRNKHLWTSFLARQEQTAMRYLFDNWHELPFLTIKGYAHAELQFINREYLLYFGARFIDRLFRPDYSPPIEFFRELFSNPQHVDVMEFVHLRIGFLHLKTLNQIVAPSQQLNFDILDNLLRNGFGELLEVIFLNIYFNDLTECQPQLYEYFNQLVWVEQESKLIFRTMQSKVGVSFVAPAEYRKFHTRLGLIIQQDMIPVLRLLYRIRFSDHENYQNILRNALTRKVPYLRLIQTIVERVIPPMQLKLLDLNNLLYHTVNNVGEGCQRLLNYLVTLGADPKNVDVNGRTLWHAAVKWNSEGLLKYIANVLQVPLVNKADNNGITVFDAALDANPFPQYLTRGNWWGMMSYLVRNMNIVVSKTLTIANIETFMISDHDANSPFLRLLFSNEENSIIIFFENNNQESTIIESIPSTDPVYARYSALIRTIPLNTWGLSSEILSLRRKLLLQKLFAERTEISVLEILVNYKDIRPFNSVQSENYRKTINFLIQHDENPLYNQIQYENIFTALVDSIIDLNDLENFKNFLHNGLMEKIKNFITAKSYFMLADHFGIFNVRQSYSAKSITLQDALLNPQIHFDPEMLKLVKSTQLFSRLIQELRHRALSNHYRNKALKSTKERVNVLGCLPRRSLRSVSLSLCHITWQDVDRFNDATNRHSISDIRVNSDRLLENLGAIEFTNPQKAEQLVDLVRQLEESSLNTHQTVITGTSKQAARDVLESRGWIEYRHKQRTTSMIKDMWNVNSRQIVMLPFRIQSKFVALTAALGISFIRGFYGIIMMCLQQTNDTNSQCLYAGSALALSVTLLPASYIAIRYVPLMIDRFTTIAIESLSSVYYFQENVKHLRYYGMRFGAHAAVVGIGLVGVGLDIFNIINAATMIDYCSKQSENCVDQQKIDYIISLTFSCSSILVSGGMLISGIGFIPGLIIGLGMMILEAVTLGLNEVFHYSSRYNTSIDENFRIFFHKIAFQPVPEDVQALVRRTQHVDYLYERATKYLEMSDESIVAFGLGIGGYANDKIEADTANINMADADVKNTIGLSRVLPTNKTNIMLCLPKQNSHEIYDKIKNTIKSAIYQCHNAFVIAHLERWPKRSSKKSYIIFDLEHIKDGVIIGSNTINNVYFIYQGTSSMYIHGGTGNINKFIITTHAFNGSIYIYGNNDTQNIVDLSTSNFSNLQFHWTSQLHEGIITNLGGYDHCYVISQSESTNLHVIGRSNKPDTFSCDFSGDHYLNHNDKQISVDGKGGDIGHMDYVNDCKSTMLRPFTHVVGSNFSTASYIVRTELSYGTDFSTESKSVYALIEPLKSNFVAIFQNFPLFISTHSVKYIPINKTLIWMLQYVDSSILHLSIKQFRTERSESQENNWLMESELIHCIFVDSYWGFTIYPVINISDNETSVYTIRNFNVFGSINSSRLTNVYDYYQHFSALISNTNVYFIMKLTYTPTNQTYTFGSIENDRFYIDENTIFLFGGDGSDVYVLNSKSPRYVFISNEANDMAMDTLVITDITCDSLAVKQGSQQLPSYDASLNDVTLICTVDDKSVSSSIHLVLRDYLMESRNRHLQIYWRNATYILIHEFWKNLNSSDSLNVHLALLFSFDNQLEPTVLTLTSNDRFITLNDTDDTNPMTVYKSKGNDVILSKKYLDSVSSSFVILEDFFVNNTTIISNAWLQTLFFIIKTNDIEDHTTMLTAHDIGDFYLATLDGDNDNDTQLGIKADFIQEYYISKADFNRNHTIIIEHNNHENGEKLKLGVLIVIGANPGEFHAKSRDNGTSLSLCTPRNCIIVRNWCQPIHRLNRVEFFASLDRPPVIIRHMDQIKCQQNTNKNVYHTIIKQLNAKLSIAKQQLSLRNATIDNDNSRLVHCIGIIFSEIIGHKFMYRLFGFTSIDEQGHFINNNCPILCTKANLANLSLTVMRNAMKNIIKDFELRDVQQDDKEVLTLIHKSLQQLNEFCWKKFTNSLYNYYSTLNINTINTSLQIFNETARLLLSRCVEGEF